MWMKLKNWGNAFTGRSKRRISKPPISIQRIEEASCSYSRIAISEIVGASVCAYHFTVLYMKKSIVRRIMSNYLETSKPYITPITSFKFPGCVYVCIRTYTSICNLILHKIKTFGIVLSPYKPFHVSLCKHQAKRMSVILHQQTSGKTNECHTPSANIQSD
jgi:hypothetical protein